MIDVKYTTKVIDLVLQNAGIPALRHTDCRLGPFVEVFYAHTRRPRNNRRKTGET